MMYGWMDEWMPGPHCDVMVVVELCGGSETAEEDLV